MVANTDGEPEPQTPVTVLAKTVAAELQEALVAVHHPDTDDLIEARTRMEEAHSAARQRVINETVGQSPEARLQAIRETLREPMRERGRVAASTMGAGFLDLIDVGAVADVVLVAFTWPLTGSRRYCYAESITELSESCEQDVPTIVASLITHLDETSRVEDGSSAMSS